LELGISKRNLKIQNYSIKFGLKPNDNVLEIGCGIGTQTKLLADFVKYGKITSVDISPKSIEIAKVHLKDYNQISFIAGDIANIEINENEIYDVIILPDVLEHIPIKDHQIIFKKFRKLLKKDGSIIINIPNPYYLKWCHINNKEALQIIDQPIYTNELIPNIYPNGFYISYLETYEVWVNNGDYQIIVLKKQENAINFSNIEQKVRLIDKIVYKLKLILNLK
jgi:ubiquinone/menaquinone biosynthesis C-methylase UbiE